MGRVQIPAARSWHRGINRLRSKTLIERNRKHARSHRGGNRFSDGCRHPLPYVWGIPYSKHHLSHCQRECRLSDRFRLEAWLGGLRGSTSFVTRCGQLDLWFWIAISKTQTRTCLKNPNQRT